MSIHDELFSERDLFLMKEAHNAGQYYESLGEWLDEVIDDQGHIVAQHLAYDADQKQAARATDSEPVAYMIHWDDGAIDLTEAPLPEFGEQPLCVIPLYIHAQLAPDVPKEDDEKGSLPWFIEVYNHGYQAGHNDTVEGYFTDVHYSDLQTYHEDEVMELLEGLNIAASREPASPGNGWVKCEDRLPEPRGISRKNRHGILVRFSSGRIERFVEVTDWLVNFMKNGPRTPLKYEAPTPDRATHWMDIKPPVNGGSDSE